MKMQLAQRDRSDETMNELRALNARFIHNFVTNDVPSHDAILHKDFVCIDPNGRRVGRVADRQRQLRGRLRAECGTSKQQKR
jgi:hypothetical protein